MSITPQEAEFEQGMEELYKEFKEQFEDEVIFDKIQAYYKKYPEILKQPYRNFDESKVLLKNKYYTASFLHSFVAIEVAIKTIALKPILYSLSFDFRAYEILYKNTFKQKSIISIPLGY